MHPVPSAGRGRSRSWPVLLLLLCAALAGCAGQTGTSTSSTSSGPSAGTSAGRASGLDPRQTTAAGAVLASRPDIAADLKGAVSTVKQFWSDEFARSGRRFQPVRTVYAYVPGDGSTCGGTPNVPNNASYCRPDDDIGFDVRWTAKVYDGLGDAFVYYLVGHEYAHAIQQRLGTSFDHTIEYELQADCYAGAYLAGEIRSRALTLEDGDIAELKAGLRAVADPENTPWFDPQAHGTAEERITYFGRGFDGSLRSCP